MPLAGRCVRSCWDLLWPALTALPFLPALAAALGKRHPVTKALDRLTVQVFHLEVGCWQCSWDEGI